jgi:hypothetical protein
MWLLPSLCPGTTKLCSGEGQEMLVDGGAHGEVSSKTGIIELLQQLDDVFALPRALWETCGCLFGVRGANS